MSHNNLFIGDVFAIACVNSFILRNTSPEHFSSESVEVAIGGLLVITCFVVPLLSAFGVNILAKRFDRKKEFEQLSLKDRIGTWTTLGGIALAALSTLAYMNIDCIVESAGLRAAELRALR